MTTTKESSSSTNHVWFPVLIAVLSSLLANGALPESKLLGIFPFWWLPVGVALFVSWMWMPIPQNGGMKAGFSSKSTTVTDRKKFILKVSILPVLVCFLAFTRSAIKRMIETGPDCERYGWYNNASSLTKCDHKPLDVHATLALLWLVAFSVQVCVLLLANNHAIHRSFGRVALGIALVNVVAMILLAVDDYLNPMKDSHRPPAFAPMMFSIAIAFLLCLIQSYRGIVERNLDQHMLWMYRAFMTTFTTPMIRFYPLVMRRIFGTECSLQNLDRLVMSSTAVAAWSTVMLMGLVQYKTQPKFWDSFMIAAAVIAVAIETQCFRSIHGAGSFLVGMTKCGLGMTDE